MKEIKWLISCEHGGFQIPLEWKSQLQIPAKILASHRGWDPGALEVARRLSQRTGVPYFFSEITRLLIDLNRSPHHHQLYSPWSRSLAPEFREEIMRQYYQPYRRSVTQAIESWISSGFRVFHLSVHSFTPLFHGVRRRAHVGFLYDPSRKRERQWSLAWRKILQRQEPSWFLRCNYPYRGVADGFIPHLRKHFPEESYWGIELEMNQALFRRSPQGSARLAEHLAQGLARILSENF